MVCYVVGLNLLSEFNLDNLTVFSTSSPSADTVEVGGHNLYCNLDLVCLDYF